MAFEVFVLGVGDTFSEVHYPTSLLLRCDDFMLAVDCPDMYRRVLKDASAQSGHSLRLASIDDVLLTHVHGDHMNGLEGAAFFKHFAQRRRLRLHSPPEVRQGLWERRLKLSMGTIWNGKALHDKSFDDYFDHQPIDWGKDTSIGPFTVQTRLTKHHVPTSALRISAEGRTLGYSCDTAFDERLIDWLADADVIIHETNYGPAHTDFRKLHEVDDRVKQKLHLIHYPDEFDPESTELKVLREGQVLTLS